MFKVEMREKFKCSYKAVDEVYRIKGWDVKSFSENKLDGIVAHLKKVGPMSLNNIASRYRCSKTLAQKAMEQAGYKGVNMKKWNRNGLIADKSDEGMYRPNVRNLLCEAWV